MDKAIAASYASQQNAGAGIIEKTPGTPGKAAASSEDEPQYIVAQNGQSAQRAPENQPAAEEKRPGVAKPQT